MNQPINICVVGNQILARIPMQRGGQRFPTFSITGIYQGSKGIRQWPINHCTFPMMILKIVPFMDYKKWMQRLDTQLNEQTN